jgi:hypothetical protein
MIMMPRQYNCRDKCVPKCNLGTRNIAVLASTDTDAKHVQGGGYSEL